MTEICGWPKADIAFCATVSVGGAVVLLQLMFLAAIGVASAVGAALLFALLLLFMPFRRAIVLAPLAVASAVVGGGVSIFLMALFVDDTLDTRTEFLVYFGGIATMAI